MYIKDLQLNFQVYDLESGEIFHQDYGVWFNALSQKEQEDVLRFGYFQRREDYLGDLEYRLDDRYLYADVAFDINAGYKSVPYDIDLWYDQYFC